MPVLMLGAAVAGGGTVLDDDQYAFVLDEIETGLAAIQAELQAADPERPKRAPRPR